MASREVHPGDRRGSLRRRWEELSPAERRRLAWKSGMVAAALGLAPVFPGLAKGGWLAFNALLCLKALFWVVRHPRAMLGTLPVILRWSLGPALLASLLARGALEGVLAATVERALPADLLFFGSLLLVTPLVLTVTLVLSVVGAGLGGRLSPAAAQDRDFAAVGVRGAWLGAVVLTLLAGGLGTLATVELPLPFLALASVPAWVAAFRPLMALVRSPLSARWLDQMLRRWLVLRPGSAAEIDLRAPVLAGLAWAIAAAAGAVHLLTPLQASSLGNLIRLRNAVHHLGARIPADEPPAGNASTNAPRVVLVDWDPESLRRAHTDASEPRLLARAIRQLASWGVARVVVAPPTLTPLDLPDSRVLPDLNEADVARARTDLGLLAEAFRECGRVVLLEPEDSPLTWLRRLERSLQDSGPGEPGPANKPDPDLQRLQAVAIERADGRLPAFQSSLLPCVPLSGRHSRPRSLPWILHEALTGQTNPVVAVPGGRSLLLDGRVLSPLDDNRLLVGFERATPGHDFVRIGLGGVLRGEPVFVGTGTGAEAWETPEKFFAGRVALLAPVAPGVRATPLGELPRMEVLAYATQTLLEGSVLARAPAGWAEGWALVLALAVGLAGRHSSPLAGSWRLLLALAAAGIGTVIAAFENWWLDPTVPAVAVVLSFLLVTQLTTVLDRLARDQNRSLLQRFVAPEVVAQLLDGPGGTPAPGGQRERLAVLFADIRGFSAFAEAHPSEEVMLTVNEYLAVLTEALNTHGGLLDKYTGDGLMALFRAGPDDAGLSARAADAALAMRDAALALSARRTASGHRPLPVGISLHVGEAVLGLVGTTERQINYTALGHTVVVAARLQGAAGGGQVVVTDSVAADLAGVFLLEERPAIQARGLSRPLPVFLVRERRPTGPPPHLPPPPPPLPPTS